MVKPKQHKWVITRCPFSNYVALFWWFQSNVSKYGDSTWESESAPASIYVRFSSMNVIHRWCYGSKWPHSPSCQIALLGYVTLSLKGSIDIFFICSCWVNIPKDLTKKIANVCVKLVEENNEIIKCLCRNLPLYLKKNKKNKWRRNILFLCSFVIHILRTHHMLYTVHKRWN